MQAVGVGSTGKKCFSPGETCGEHQVLWEASIEGVVILAKEAGSLPVKDVIVHTRL